MNLLQTECEERNIADGFDKLTTRLETTKCDEKRFTGKICVITNGCPENRIDCSRMQKFLGDNGNTVTADIKEADIVVFNACGLTHDTQEYSVKIIKHIQALKKPSAELVVCGCLPKINMPRLKEVHQGFTFGHEVEQLAEVIKTKPVPSTSSGKALSEAEGTDPDETYANHLSPRAHVPTIRRWRISDLKKIASLMLIKEKLTKSYYDRLDREINAFRSHSFCIKVSTGCPNRCTFCAVKVSRGKLRSKPIDKVVEEFEEGLAKGYKEFALLGTDVGAYGRDQGKTLVDLLIELTKREGEYKIRIRNIQPRFLIEMMPEFREVLRSGKISYISSAAESGNNRILGLMRRGYKIEDYKKAILGLKREFPKLHIRTQIMVGFPSETEEEFEDSLRLFDEIDYDFVEVYQYQPRPNTEAAAMKDQVPAKISGRRYHKAYMKAISKLKKKRP